MKNMKSLNEGGKLPVLDLEIEVNPEGQIVHRFYSKPMASPYSILYNSALPAKTKRESLLQEGLRRLRNMGQGVPQTEINDCLSKFINRLRISGYNESYRFQLLSGIICASY